MLRKQLVAVIADLGPSYEFTFLDGAFTCERGPGMFNTQMTLNQQSKEPIPE